MQSFVPAVPTPAQVRAVIPDECFERRLSTSLAYTGASLTLTLGCAFLAFVFIPISWAWAPLWLAYAYVNGTIAVGLWVIAHECGHRAFARSNVLQDAVGFILHSSLLVPYFSWQRSHALHHGRTNHVIEGETHVPKRLTTPAGRRTLSIRDRMGAKLHGIATIASRLGFGWPTYLLTGLTGGPERGVTNHFWPIKPFSSSLFPTRWHRRVWASAAGVGAFGALLCWWALARGPMEMVVLYVGPYLVVNAWLVTYTWLQHTDVDIPHFDEKNWSFVAGAFCSVDRPYGRFADALHHRIGTTHVAHHLDAKIPHYHAARATRAIAESFPHLYRYNPLPIRWALWNVATTCHVVAEQPDGWRFTTKVPAPATANESVLTR